MKRTSPTLAATVLAALLLGACGGSDGSDASGKPESDTVTLVTHNSFAASEDVLEQFTEETGYRVEVLRGGDAGATVNQAILSKGNPQGDLLFGIDNTMLSKALDEELFTEYRADGVDAVPEDLRLDDEGRVTPIDTGDVCVNYDRAYFEERDVEPPQTLDDLTDPAYEDLLVVENAATSSPGLAFLLATVGEFGEDGWQDYWKRLKDNGVAMVDGWEQAYDGRFTGSASGGKSGDRPLVVSYASSPPAEVVYGEDQEPAQAPTGVSTGTCFRQIEFAGLLDGAANAEGGRALLDFMIGRTFQEDMPLNMFVNPVLPDAELPEVFTEYGEQIDDPHRVAPERIAQNREQWVKQWSALLK